MNDDKKKDKVSVIRPIGVDDKDQNMRPVTESLRFDHWLERKLHTMFDSIASEPIPEDIMYLINKLDEKERKQDKD